MVEGLDQMHLHDFAHRDLKPGNILIKSMPPKEKWWIVLAAFGISKRADESVGPTTTIKGTTMYMAPELLGYLDKVKPKSIDDFKAADMWAVGEISFQMLTGEATFRNLADLMKYCTGQRGFPFYRLPISVTDDGCEFITNIMMALPQTRMSTTQCIQRRWLKSLCLEEEFDALNLNQSILPVPDSSLNRPVSARQPSPLENECTPAQATAQRGPTIPLYPSSSNADRMQLKSTPSRPLVQPSPNTTRRSSVPVKMTLMQTLEGHSREVADVAFSLDALGLRRTELPPHPHPFCSKLLDEQYKCI